ncbi:MAG TPA: HD domain-containing phosphohydrolase, partial [Spirochaetia bacterium]
RGAGVIPLGSTGTLRTNASAVADSWSAGLPVQTGVVAMPAGVADVLYCCPVSRRGAVTTAALVVQAKNLEPVVRGEQADIQLAVSVLSELLPRRPRAHGLLHEAPGTAGRPALLTLEPGIELLAEGLRLPLYVCDLDGAFLFVSPAFLELTGYRSLEELAGVPSFFKDPRVRRDELDTIRTLGKVSTFPLTVIAGNGVPIEIRESAVVQENTILGVFFDVTSLASTNAELKDMLQIQELLNDSILSASMTLQRTQAASIRTLARLAEYRDHETGFHLQRICEYTRLLAVEVRARRPYAYAITREYSDDIALSSMLHDIGKVSIPDRILLKKGPLEAVEWATMKKHTVFGWEVLHKADLELGEQSFLTLAATIALSHHERFDGKGYPNSLAGEQIPLSARISALADVYDALTVVRPYKEAWSHEHAVEEILRAAGTHFDPALVEIFRDVNGEFDEVHRRYP